MQSRCVTLWMLSASLLISPVLVADDYLQAVEAEAELSANVPSEDAPVAQRADAAPEGRRVDFERALQAQRPSIFTFYGRLSDTDRNRVVQHYIDTSDNMIKAVNMTLDLYFKRK